MYCNDEVLKASTLEWGPGNELPEVVEMNSFNALAGAMLILKFQRVFDDVELSNDVSDKTGVEASKIENFDLTRDGLKIVNFWASWCAPCLAERPLLNKIADLGIPIYGVNYKDEEQNALNFLVEHGNFYSSEVSDESGYIGLDWDIFGISQTFLIDSKGHIIDRILEPITKNILDKRILPNVDK